MKPTPSVSDDAGSDDRSAASGPVPGVSATGHTDTGDSASGDSAIRDSSARDSGVGGPGAGGAGVSDRLLTGAFMLLFALSFLQEWSFGLMVHLPGYLESLGADESTIGLVYASAAFVALALRPLIGRFIDQVGRRTVMLIGGLLFTVAPLLFIPLTAVGPPMFLARIFYMSVEVTLFTTVIAIGADIIPASRRIQGLALLGLAGLLPIGLGSVVGDLVAGDGNYTRLFVIAAALSFASWSLAWGLPRLVSADPHRERHRGFFPVLTQRNLGPVWLLTGAFVTGLITMFTFLRTYVDASGRGSVGLYLGIYSVVAVVMRLSIRTPRKKKGLVRLVVVAIGVVVAEFVVLGATGSVPAMMVAAALGGAGHGLVFPVLTTMVVNRASAEERGTALAVFSGMFDVGTLIVAPAAGFVIEAIGYGPTFEIVGVVIAAMLAGFLLWERRVQSTEVVPD